MVIRKKIVELVEYTQLLVGIQSLIPHESSHHREILLLDIVLVIFLFLAGAGVGDLVPFGIPDEMPVYKLPAGIKINAKKREWQSFFNDLQSLNRMALGFSHECPALIPTCARRSYRAYGDSLRGFLRCSDGPCQSPETQVSFPSSRQTYGWVFGFSKDFPVWFWNGL